MPKLYSR
jgi:hypothetical protein